MRLGAAVLPPESVPPPGVDPRAWRTALRADVHDLLDELAGIETIVEAGTPDDAWRALAGHDIAAVLAGDAPDLPGLLVGKLFGGCEDRPVSVLPAEGGGLVGVAARLPVPDWLAGVTLGTGLDALHERAAYRSVVVGPGWHRLRGPADVGRLDPRLDGWYATRALLQSPWT